MPATVIVGLQWGDEGKGKTTDFLAEDVTAVVRYQGGDNAGHTIMLGEEVFKLHLVPSGVLYPHITPIIGNGVVVNPATLISELDMLASRGLEVDRVRVSRHAHVIMPYHIALDGAMEARLAKAAVGTTRRGIGPAYADRAWRIGIRMEDLLDGQALRDKLARILPEKNATLQRQHHMESFDLEDLVVVGVEWGKRLAPHMADTTQLVQERLARGDHLLFEGAQGTLLDLDHGSYPFVTSSNPIAGGACTGGGIGPLQIDEVIGVMKAYATRVGSGPFPTELEGPIGTHLLQKGREFGTTTGRMRRCGWFDSVVARYAARINGLTNLAITKLDVLDSFDEVSICVGYRADGEIIDTVPADMEVLNSVEPEYENHAGWRCSTADARALSDLPREARAYLDRMAELVGAPISYVSVGNRRDQVIEVP